MGNHDRSRDITWWKEVGFNEVIEYPIIYKNFWILSHEPVCVNNSMPYVNIRGHLHRRKIEGQYFNVGVELSDFTPVEFEKIERMFVEPESV